MGPRAFARTKILPRPHPVPTCTAVAFLPLFFFTLSLWEGQNGKIVFFDSSYPAEDAFFTSRAILSFRSPNTGWVFGPEGLRGLYKRSCHGSRPVPCTSSWRERDRESGIKTDRHGSNEGLRSSPFLIVSLPFFLPCCACGCFSLVHFDRHSTVHRKAHRELFSCLR